MARMFSFSLVVENTIVDGKAKRFIYNSLAIGTDEHCSLTINDQVHSNLDYPEMNHGRTFFSFPCT